MSWEIRFDTVDSSPNFTTFLLSAFSHSLIKFGDLLFIVLLSFHSRIVGFQRAVADEFAVPQHLVLIGSALAAEDNFKVLPAGVDEIANLLRVTGWAVHWETNNFVLDLGGFEQFHDLFLGWLYLFVDYCSGFFLQIAQICEFIWEQSIDLVRLNRLFNLWRLNRSCNRWCTFNYRQYLFSLTGVLWTHFLLFLFSWFGRLWFLLRFFRVCLFFNVLF